MMYKEFEQMYERKLGAGNNPNTGDLAYCIADDPNTPGACFLISCWEPTVEELAEIVRTGKLYLAVMANPDAPTQPPVALHGFNPLTGYGDQSYVRWPENWREIEAKKKRAAAVLHHVRLTMKGGGDPYEVLSVHVSKEEIDEAIKIINDGEEK